MFFKVSDDFNIGRIPFNLGTNWSFLYNNQWHPKCAFMITYYQQLDQNNECNLYHAVFELSKFIPVISADINYKTTMPILHIK